jgi:hypothetical protein
MAENSDAPDKVCFREKHSVILDRVVGPCPDHLFGNQDIYDDVVAVLRHLNVGLNDRSDGGTLLTLPIWAFWYEVNGIKSLFGGGQAWTLFEAGSFIEYARAYMEL